MFANNAYATIIKIIKKAPKYLIADISTSKKNKTTNKYEVDFRHYVTFVYKSMNKDIKEKDKIKLLEVGVSINYNKETSKSYTDFVVFDIENVSAKGSPKTLEPMAEINENGNDLPF
jgi:hypothetical protein